MVIGCRSVRLNSDLCSLYPDQTGIAAAEGAAQATWQGRQYDITFHSSQEL